ncbi:GNAT family N-acetyltransferase [Streptomyces piniterrae]|uniref:GNAT family N-acetyltransferase n=1 Tax=Streptomyces piniterrae TaxID=2571125 RepID=A0A4U0NR14_9ACTN|nr:GNAT family N-acetyltransferase [Streptomyces piniterrae]TJZ57019.1 GNAT family N-acetyltransferase [Streptomyces piniterrae]
MAVDTSKIEIIRADESHLPEVVALAGARSLDPSDLAAAGRDGFLVSDYTLDDYRSRLTHAEHFWVAVRDNEVLGFLLAYTDEQLEPEEWLNHRIKTSLGSFLVIKQVCVSRNAARRGVASRLYHHVLEQWPASPVIAAVVSEPYNHASARFHRKLGFEELTRLTPPDGRPRTVWVWRKPRESMLQVQYSVAVDLYKHEDTTNWHKLNNFFYITAAMAAAVAVTLGKDGAASKEVARSLALIIAAIGFGCSLAFSQMLRFGRRYLLARKSAVMELEEHMAWHGGQRIVGRDTGSAGNSWLRSSPTGLIMIVLPLLVAVCWVAMGVVIAAM